MQGEGSTFQSLVCIGPCPAYTLLLRLSDHEAELSSVTLVQGHAGVFDTETQPS